MRSGRSTRGTGRAPRSITAFVPAVLASSAVVERAEGAHRKTVLSPTPSYSQRLAGLPSLLVDTTKAVIDTAKAVIGRSYRSYRSSGDDARNASVTETGHSRRKDLFSEGDLNDMEFDRPNASGVSALVFSVLVTTLIALRAGNFAPAILAQWLTVIVAIAAIAIFVSVLFYVSSGSERLRTVTGVSALVFVLLITPLTALRVWALEPPTSVESALVNATAMLVLISVGVYAYRGGTFVGGWILAFGPSLAFTLNLFVPVSTGAHWALAFAIVSGAVIASVIAVSGYLAGSGLDLLARDGGGPSES